MKLTTTKEKILFAAVIAERVVGKRESLPILSCVLLDVGNTISVRATNLESGVDIGISADVEEKGEVAVPASIFSQTIRSINSDKVSLKTDSENLIVESRGTRALIKAVPHEEFPTLSWDDDGEKNISILRLTMIKGIQSVLCSTSHSMIRPELGSVYISIKKDGIVFAATDSFRLAERVIKGRVFSGNDQHVWLHVYPKKKIFSATAQSPDVGETSDLIDAAVSGEDVDINFHIGYLSDCVSAIDSDSITLGFSGPGRPLVISGVSDPGFTYLVMPLNR